MEWTSCLHEKRRAFFFHELCHCKQLGVLNKKEKEMFARELAFIKDLEKSEQEASGGIRSSDKAPGSMANPFDGLFYSLSPSVLPSFVDIPQSFGSSLG